MNFNIYNQQTKVYDRKNYQRNRVCLISRFLFFGFVISDYIAGYMRRPFLVAVCKKKVDEEVIYAK